MTNKNGAERILEKPKRVSPWWTENTGVIVFLIVSYGKNIEF